MLRIHLTDPWCGLALRDDLLPPIPESLAGREFDIEYRSPLARSQKQQELEAIDQFSARVQAMAETKPEVVDFINFDEIVTKTSYLLGIDPKLVNDAAAVKKIRYLREKAQQQQAQAAERVAMAEQMAQASQAAPATELALAE